MQVAVGAFVNHDKLLAKECIEKTGVVYGVPSYDGLFPANTTFD